MWEHCLRGFLQVTGVWWWPQKEIPINFTDQLLRNTGALDGSLFFINPTLVAMVTGTHCKLPGRNFRTTVRIFLAGNHHDHADS